MISSFRIKNFKSYRDATLPLAPLTLLIGANASGKSNAIEAIRLLSMLSDGRRLDDIISEIQSSDDLVRGTSADLPRTPGEPIGLGCELADRGWNRLELGIRLDGHGAMLDFEAVTHEQGVDYYHVSDASMLHNDYRLVIPHALGRQAWATVVSSRQAVFPRLEALASTSDGLIQEVADVGRSFRSNLERVSIFDPQPRRMRGYSNESEQVLKEDGSNISAVLHELHYLEERALLDFVAVLPEQPFVAIDFITTSRGDLMVRLTESYGGREEIRDAPVLSDGTLRVLGIAAALLSAEEGSTIIIEEIDNGVHPSRAETLLRNIERVAKERGLRVLLTTHNPAMLDRLPADAIPHVVCAYRDPEEGDSRLVRLEDLPSYPELVARGPLGQLMTRGVLDYFLKPRESGEEKKEKALRWIETLKAQVGDA